MKYYYVLYLRVIKFQNLLENNSYTYLTSLYIFQNRPKITIEVLSDNLEEADEVLFLKLADPINAIVGDNKVFYVH